MKFNYKQQRTTRANSAASALARKQASISNQNYTPRVALLKFLLGSKLFPNLHPAIVII